MDAEFYVYELVDPRDLSVFYVGKGRGDRVKHHQREVMRHGTDSARTDKEKRIAAILESGRLVTERIVALYYDEQAALDHEADLIAQYGIENLTNVMSRGAMASCSHESVVKIARQIHARACEWINEDLAAMRSSSSEEHKQALMARVLHWLDDAACASKLLKICEAKIADRKTGGVLPVVCQARQCDAGI